MSDAAKQYVDTCVHPQVKDGVRAVFDALAALVPEGHTTTPLIGMKELAVPAGLDRRTVLSRLQVLVTIGEVDVVDGGQGKIARYRIVRLDGERLPTVVPLPLRADLRQVPPAEPVIASVDPPAELVITSWPVLVITSWVRAVLVITSTVLQGFSRRVLVITSWVRRQLVITSSPLDGTRAGAVLLLKEVLLPPDAAAPLTRPPPDPNPSRCRWFPKTHAWCAGRDHVPTQLDEDFRRKLGRLPGETERDQRARAWEIYATEAAKLPEDHPTALNDFAHWRPILAAVLARAAPSRTATNPRAAPDVDLYARARAERQQRQGSGFS